MVLTKFLADQDIIKSKKGFNFWAPFYFTFRYLAYRDSIAQIQTELVPLLPKHKNHLIIGDGNADVSKAVCKDALPSTCTVLDFAPKMLERAKRKSKSHAISFQVGTIQDYQDYQSIDIVHLPFILDLLSDEEIRELSVKWFDQLPFDASLHIVDFEEQENRTHQHFLYTIFRITAGIHRKQLPAFESLLKDKWVPTKKLKKGRFKATLWEKRSDNY